MSTGEDWSLDQGESFDRWSSRIVAVKSAREVLQQKLTGPRFLTQDPKNLTEELQKELRHFLFYNEPKRG